MVPRNTGKERESRASLIIGIEQKYGESPRRQQIGTPFGMVKTDITRLKMAFSSEFEA